MIFECPHCSQSLEVENAGAGQTIHCPTCGHPVIIPDPTAAEVSQDLPEPSSVPRPPMYVPLQPVAPGSSKPLIKKKKGLGCSGLILLLMLIAGAAFGYAMFRFHESPTEVYDRLTNYLRSLAAKPTAPAPEASPSEAPPLPTPAPDPVAWLIEHRESWPKEVILREAFPFPAVSGGKVVGSVRVPARATVNVVGITKDEVEADYMGGRRRLPLTATDLLVRAEAALSQANTAAREQPTAGLTGASPKPQPQRIREASQDEISKGLGALYTRQATTFRVFAPNNKSVSLVIYDQASGVQGRTVRPLKRQANNEWELTVGGDLAGKFYTFLLDVEDQARRKEVLDPYATNSVANSSRGRITPLTTPPVPGPELASATDAVIYEMQVRDFTIAPSSGVKNSGLYLGWTEAGTRLPDDDKIQTCLDHLTELGVTHVELMPVQDFDNDEESRSYNWGYITNAFFSPEGMFATVPNDDSRVRELKALIGALHARGIGVIMDVVYNHTSSKCSLLSIGPGYYYRRAPNGSMANGSGCGNEFKSESPMGRRLILDSLKFWTQEYGIDGFRFDLMALIDQDTIREADRELRKIKPGVILFGEPWTGGVTPLRDKSDKSALARLPAGAFNDDFRNALKGSPDREDPGWIQNGSKRDALKAAMLVNDWCARPQQSINYMTCHDNLVLWDKLMFSMPNATDALRIQTMKLGYLALLTSQGVPFIHGGEEFARTKGGNNNSFEAPDSVNQVDWTLKREHIDLFNYVRDLIALRKAHPMLRLRSRPEVRSRVNFIDPPDHALLMFTVNGDGVMGENWKRMCVVMNSADQADAEINLPFGQWSVAMDEHGAASEGFVAGKITVRHKSGLVLFQQ
jgi:pullulanase